MSILILESIESRLVSLLRRLFQRFSSLMVRIFFYLQSDRDELPCWVPF